MPRKRRPVCACVCVGLQAYKKLGEEPPAEEEIRKLIAAVDTKNCGHVDPADFTRAMSSAIADLETQKARETGEFIYGRDIDVLVAYAQSAHPRTR